MLDKYYKVVLYNLEKYSIPYYLKMKLIDRFNPTYHTEEDNQIARRNNEKERERKEVKIKHLEALLGKANLAETRNLDIDYTKIAFESSIYFRQSYEMFKTALSMDENSSPLVEYYALLQCVKGVILLEYKLTNELFFLTHHGLSLKDGYQVKRPYLCAKVHNKGVFYGLLLLFAEVNMSGFLKIDDYLDNQYNPSFVDVIKGYRPLDTFVGSWMLSNIVRYKPPLWSNILMGKEDAIIDTIREFRGEQIPRLVEEMFRLYNYRSSLPSKWGY